jgi:hypothetical protein
MSYQETIASDARMILLRELAAQLDGQLNEMSLRRMLDAFGIKRSRDWLVTQLNHLVGLDAIKLKQAGEILIAQITPLGRDHVDERAIIGGVTRPSELGG